MGRRKNVQKSNRFFYLIILCFVVLLFSVSSATPSTITSAFKQTEQGNGAVPMTSPLFSLFANWKQIVLLLSLIVILLMGLAYMAAGFFGLPRLRSWALVEFGNVVATFLIIFSIIAVLQFSDNLLRYYVNTDPSSPFTCSNNQMCTVSVANQYLEKMISLAENTGRAAYVAGWQAMRDEIQGHTISCSSFFVPPCLGGYITFRPNSYELLDYERSMIEMRAATNIAEALIVQLFVSRYITYLVGPVLLILGIIARAFPGTRSAGGVLLASGFAVLFVFPAMYLWNAMSLNIAVYGTNLLNVKDNCPAVCKDLTIPIGYKNDNGAITKAYKPSDVFPSLSTSSSQNSMLTERDKISKFLNGTLAQWNGYTSCEYLAKQDSFGYCPFVCRVIPYPFYISLCGNNKTELACDHLTNNCKIVHDVPNAACDTDPVDDGCPTQCMVRIPAPADGSECDSCVDAPAACRVALPLDPPNYPWRLRSCVENKQNPAVATATVNCPADCMYILGNDPDAKCVGPFCCVGKRCFPDRVNKQVTIQKTITLTKTESGHVEINLCQDSNGQQYPCVKNAPELPGQIDLSNYPIVSLSDQQYVDSSGNKHDEYYNVSSAVTSSNVENYYISEYTDPAACSGFLGSGKKADCHLVLYDKISTTTQSVPTVASAFVYKCLDGSGNANWGPALGCAPGTCFTTNPQNNPVCAKVSGETCADVANFPDDVRNNYFPYCNSNPGMNLYYNTSAECWNTKKWCKVVNGKCQNIPACIPHGPQVEAPVKMCNNCSDVPQECQFYRQEGSNQIHVIPYCAQRCYTENAGGSPDVLTPAEFVSKSRNNLVGRKDIIDVASLYLPAYALPLLNILVTLVFIRTFAPVFGGDYYIPGWIKIL